MAHHDNEILRKEWNKKEGPIVFSTVDSSGHPNSVYVMIAELSKDGKIVLADNHFKKTKINILKGSKASVLFMTRDGKPIQVKGTVAYDESGEYFQFMKSWNPGQHPGNAAVVISVEQIYSGSDQLL